MRTLGEKEKLKVLRTLDPLIRNKKVEASCVYGSQISGYARENSDYDVILVLSRFLQRIKYYYLKGETECSVLTVDSRSFLNDCLKSSMGEFVSGRLLNPYEALLNGNLLRECEVSFKKRVILEGLQIAQAEAGPFAEEIIFDLSYFLFEKLRRRASLYPPVIYSYSQTYGEERLSSNKEAAIDGFRQAAKQLESEKLIEFLAKEDKVRIRPDKFRSGLGAKLGARATYTARGIRQYAVHGYAGRVGFDIVRHEVSSKLSRSKEHVALPKCLEFPKLFWSLPDAKLFPESSDWVSDMMVLFGMEQKETVVTNTSLGEMYSSAKFLTFEGKTKTRSFAAKRYNDAKGMKWGLLNLWTLRNTKFSIGALERLHREFNASRIFGKMGIATPRILAVFLSEKILITQFVRGKDLSKVQSGYLNGSIDDLSAFSEFGRTLATLHGNGFCMGDTKPSNAVLSDEDKKVYLTDLEQAHKNGNPTWDIAEYIYYSIRFTLKEKKVRELIESFVNGYESAGGSSDTIRKSTSLRYRAPFQAFIAPNVLSSALKELRAR